MAGTRKVYTPEFKPGAVPGRWGLPGGKDPTGRFFDCRDPSSLKIVRSPGSWRTASAAVVGQVEVEVLVGLPPAVALDLDGDGLGRLAGGARADRPRAWTGSCGRHNTVFQGLAADGAKLVMWKLWRAGFRLVNFVHDEFVAEVPADGDLGAAADRIQALMIEGMKEVVPTLPVRVECAAMRAWSKGAEPVFDDRGRLCVWEPKPPASSAARAAP